MFSTVKSCKLLVFLVWTTLVPAVIGIATTILSAVLVWTIKSADPFKKGSATCLKVLGILFVVQAATSLYAGSLKTSVSIILFAHDFEKVSGLATKGEA